MPQPVQLVEFDPAERQVLLDAGQPKAVEAAMRAAIARMKEQLKAVSELASVKSVGASPEQLTQAAGGLHASVAVLKVCPVGEVADLLALQEKALGLIAEGQQISAGLPASATASAPDDSQREEADGGAATGFGSHDYQ
ncbi:hypothetical protein [Streptomyces goshikiensis]|uniref:hypothetical protein n=1 Tax=Streptomyces goshikiensis TaxID=1942 RepID=UPI00369EFDAD